MRLAFYAPMKAPDHTVPSGDRAMARGLVAALEHGGAQVTIAASLRSRDGTGDAQVQARLMDEAAALCPAIIAQGARAGWQAWVTYHNYYKAPDLIGPNVARALGIPYLLIEATRARKRLGGPWDRFARAAEVACDAAQVVFYLTERDSAALKSYASANQHLIHLPPFLARSDLPPLAQGSGLLSVGMMRAGAKMASYQLIADTLTQTPGDWQLELAGDGPARAQVERAMASLAGRVRFLGQLDADKLACAYARAGALIWPGVDEAFGMIYLEAQAHGLPVIAQDRPGVRDVLYPRAYPAVEEGAKALARFTRETLDTPPAPSDIRAHIAARHLLPAAARTLRRGIALAGVA